MRIVRRLQKAGMMGEKLLAASRKYIEEDCFPHFHDFYEIEYVLSGAGSSVVNGKEEVQKQGMLFFLTPIDCHSVRTGGLELVNIMFSEQLVDFGLLEPFLRYGSPRIVEVDPAVRPFLEQLFREIVENSADTDYCAALMGCLLRKMAQLFSCPQGGNAGGTLSRIHSYIITNYRSGITLGSVAAHVGLTPSYVSALFKKEMRVGFKEYLNSLRLEYARKLLITTEQSVQKICEESGFEDVPNFIKRFKVCYGVSPTVLRKNWKESAKA